MTTLILQRDALHKALDRIGSVVEARSTIPILSNVLLTVSDGRAALAASDLDIFARAGVGAVEADQSGAITLPHATLRDIARKLPEGARVNLTWADDGRATLSSGRSRFTLNTLSASDFPSFDDGAMAARFELPAATLADIIARTRFAVSDEETRYFLNGIFLHHDRVDGADWLVAVATNGHQMARMRVAAPEGVSGMPGIIVPKKTVDLMRKIADKRIADKRAEPITIEVSDTKIRLAAPGDAFDDVVITSKLIDGTYPDYARIIPQANSRRAVLDLKPLDAAVDRVSTIASDKGRAVRFAFGAEGLELSCAAPEQGEAREEIDANYESDPIEIGFNARYVADIVGALGADTAELLMDAPGSPTVWRRDAEAPALYILMPMRV